MRFKKDAIKPDTVIFCRRKEDEQELLKYLKSRGYATDGVPIFENSYLCPWEDKDGKNVGWSGCEDKSVVVNFSDLIEPDDSPADSDTDSPMTAVEVLKWLRNSNGDTRYNMFDVWSVDDIVSECQPQEIVDKIVAYEAAKAQKPVEVEHVWLVQIHEQSGAVVYEEELPPTNDVNFYMEEDIKSFKGEADKKYYATVEHRCRIKEEQE